MRTAIIISVAFLIGVVIGISANHRVNTRLRKKIRALRKGETPEKMATTKKIIWICLANGFVWVWCSYILAYLDKPQIAESLSQAAVTEIVGVVLAYCIKSAVENLSKNNKWPDKPETTSEGPEPEREEPSDVGQ